MFAFSITATPRSEALPARWSCSMADLIEARQVALAPAAGRRVPRSARGAGPRPRRPARPRRPGSARASSGSSIPGATCTPSMTTGVPSSHGALDDRRDAGADRLGLLGVAPHVHLERRGVDGGHEVTREGCPEHLTDHVRGDHARDAEPVRGHRRERRLARLRSSPTAAGRAAGRAGSGAPSRGSARPRPRPPPARAPPRPACAARSTRSTRSRPPRAAARSARASSHARAGSRPIADSDCAIRPFE